MIWKQVYWVSQSAGVAKEKTGRVVEIVPAKLMPTTKVREVGGPRDHESYVVEVTPIGKRGQPLKPRYYWPRVSQLQVMKHAEDGA